jgi:hypothetical protein
MEIRDLVETITREILKSLQKDKQAVPKVLYIFCDSTAHEPFVEQFIKLKNHGIQHDMLFLDGETSSWLGMNRIESGGAGKLIAADEYAPAPLELPKEYDAVVVPEIDLDNAARVVSGLKGTVKAEIIFSALVLQKIVIVGDDVPGIKRADRRTLQTLSLPLPYQKLFQQYMAAMKELGIEFRQQKDLAEAVIQKVKEKRQTEPIFSDQQAADETLVFQGRFLSAEWVKSQPGFPDQQVWIAEGVIVSPLAFDILKEKGVRVQYLVKG